MELDQLYVGQRVRVTEKTDCYCCRTGVVVLVDKQRGGALVRHDLPDLDLESTLNYVIEESIGKEYDFSLWGWAASELDPGDVAN